MVGGFLIQQQQKYTCLASFSFLFGLFFLSIIRSDYAINSFSPFFCEFKGIFIISFVLALVVSRSLFSKAIL